MKYQTLNQVLDQKSSAIIIIIIIMAMLFNGD
jgi:hypothetical protein